MPDVALFSVDDARAFDKLQLADDTTYPDAVITAACDRITAMFRNICGVSFVPITETAIMNGAGSRLLAIVDSEGRPVRRLSAVSAVTVRVFGVDYAFTSDELVTLRILPGGIVWRDWLSQMLDSYIYGFGYGIQSVTVSYTHGYATPPAEISWAALKLLVSPAGGVVPSNLPDGATLITSGEGSFTLATAGTRRNQFSNLSYVGIPSVDEVLYRYNERAGTIA